MSGVPDDPVAAAERPLADLLVVQALDTTADQLRHRRSHLPERAAAQAKAQERAVVVAEAAGVEASRQGLLREQRRLEDEIAGLDDKATAANTTLYSGSVRAPRELQALQDDVDSLRRRQRQLEDEVLERMEAIEPLEHRLAALAGAVAGIDSVLAELAARIDDVETVIAAELDDAGARRAAAALAVPTPVLAEYESLRGGMGGIGAARLTGNRCEGCHLALPAAEVEAVRRTPPGSVAHCSECGRILVR
ncbi:MAG: zinc ribbon domain-containing protein [Acidimicrobiia bacterium]